MGGAGYPRAKGEEGFAPCRPNTWETSPLSRREGRRQEGEPRQENFPSVRSRAVRWYQALLGQGRRRFPSLIRGSRTGGSQEEGGSSPPSPPCTSRAGAGHPLANSVGPNRCRLRPFRCNRPQHPCLHPFAPPSLHIGLTARSIAVPRCPPFSSLNA